MIAARRSPIFVDQQLVEPIPSGDQLVCRDASVAVDLVGVEIDFVFETPKGCHAIKSNGLPQWRRPSDVEFEWEGCGSLIWTGGENLPNEVREPQCHG